MGEVYRARDTRLDREVAIKVSKEQFTERFEREARTVAALNHPNICQLYDVGPDYLVMELIEGETPKGPMDGDEVFLLAQQIASALDAAHEKGIVHRDLKPANIKVTAGGVVKVLDFGLAKMAGKELPSGPDSPTFTMGSTQAGVLLGTAGYMAPEQARGKVVDKRADIWAFGVVLYELLTGEHAFQGDTVSDTLASVLRETPAIEKAPSQFRTLLGRCLEKDPQKRLRDIGDAMALAAETPEVAAKAPKSSKLPWAAAALFAGIAGVLGAIHFREQPPSPPPPVRYQIRLPEGVHFTSSGTFTLSPDGRRLAFSAYRGDKSRVWVQDIDAMEPRELEQTVTGSQPPPFFWSPDGRYIVYSENSPRLKKVDVQTGTVQDISNKPGPPVGGSWNKDGLIIFGSPDNGLWKVPASGGKAAPLTALDTSRGEKFHQLPSFLPDGHHFLYLIMSADLNVNGIYVASIDDPPEKQGRKRILSADLGGYFVPSREPGASETSGNLLFMRDNTLMAQEFDANKLELRGEPEVVAEGVGSVFQTGLFTAAGSSVVYRTALTENNVQATWYDRQGHLLQKVGEPGPIEFLRLSPDGTRVAYARQSADLNSADVWILDLKRETNTRLTFGPGPSIFPVWSPDGKELVFAHQNDKVWELDRKPTNGAREEEPLLKTDENLRPWNWSPNGRFLLYSTSKSTSFAIEDIWVLPMEGDRKPYPLVATRFDQNNARFSPNGRFVAYVSNESGVDEVYVREFEGKPGESGRGAKWLVSKDSGERPEWRPDGTELAYHSRTGQLFTVPVKTTGTFESGAPQLLFSMPIPGLFSPSPDFQKFLLRTPLEKKIPQALTVMLNWRPAQKAH
jgi:serine/threonine protein kinase